MAWIHVLITTKVFACVGKLIIEIFDIMDGHGKLMTVNFPCPTNTFTLTLFV